MTKSRHHRAQRRRESLYAAEDTIDAMTDDELNNVAFELGREMAARSQETNELRKRLTKVQGEKERRRTVTSVGICVSDHAVLRYLERHKGLDVAAVREEIMRMAGRVARLDSGDIHATRHDEVSGLTIGLNEVTGVVTTLYNAREEAVMDVPDFTPRPLPPAAPSSGRQRQP